MRFSRIVLTIIFCWMLLGACQPTNGQPETVAQTNSPTSVSESDATQPQTSVSTPEGTAMTPVIPPDETTAHMVTLVTQHLAKNLSVAVDQIQLKDVKAVVWRDAGLGCPKPGVDYIQMETPGFNILLDVGGQTYNYHTDAAKRFVLCKK